MECIMDYIGLSYCEADAGAYAPAVYLNSLPGITIESIDKIAEADQVTYKGVWNDVQTSAIRQFKIDVISEIKKCYQLNRECDYEELVCDNLEILVYAWMYLCAIWLMQYRLTSSRLNRFTTVDKDKATELLSFYQDKYSVALSQSVLLMDVSGCELCCGNNPEVVTWIP